MGATTLRDMMERGERVTVVDVRKGEDHAEWSIPGSVHYDAYDALHAGDERAMEGLELPQGVTLLRRRVRRRGRSRRRLPGTGGVPLVGRRTRMADNPGARYPRPRRPPLPLKEAGRAGWCDPPRARACSGLLPILCSRGRGRAPGRLGDAGSRLDPR